MSVSEKDVKLMRRALELARRGWGDTHPNPMVGALIVEDGRIVAEGFHERAGEPHAEIHALRALGRSPGKDAVLYVTLEPCSTEGKTGACTDALVQAGFHRVVVGAVDPNPEHSGRGIEILREAGIDVVEGVLEDDCRDLNLIFNHWIARRESLLAGKCATTLDGRIATRTGESRWITSEGSRADVMRWRRLFPAIGVGAGTVMTDNPRLTSRIEGAPEWCPIRFVFDGLLRTMTGRDIPALYSDEFRERTVVVTSEHAGMGYARKLEALGVRVWVIPGPSARVSFADFRRHCTREGITGVYVEGGAELLGAMLQTKAIDYLFHYRAPMLFGDHKARPMLQGMRTERLTSAVRMERVRHEVHGDDFLVRGVLRYPERWSVDETVFVRGGLEADK